MIVDLRIYTIRAGRLAEFVKTYQEHAWPLQQKHLGRCLGWYTSAEGPLNQSCISGAMTARRIASAGATRWRPFRRGTAYPARLAEMGLLVAQGNRFLKPTAFSPVQ